MLGCYRSSVCRCHADLGSVHHTWQVGIFKVRLDVSWHDILIEGSGKFAWRRWNLRCSLVKFEECDHMCTGSLTACKVHFWQPCDKQCEPSKSFITLTLPVFFSRIFPIHIEFVVQKEEGWSVAAVRRGAQDQGLSPAAAAKFERPQAALVLVYSCFLCFKFMKP